VQIPRYNQSGTQPTVPAMSPAIDYTAVVIALIGLATAAVSGAVLVLVRVLELRAAESARRAESHADRACACGGEGAKRAKGRRKKPGHPCE